MAAKRPHEKGPKRNAGGPRGLGKPPSRRDTVDSIAGLRIIGGRFRGRKLLYSGDRRTRPMKDRLREAIFNLIGPAVRGSHAIDLFAGTGALGLEAVSRGADRATLIEQHHPTAALIRQNAASLEIADRVEVVPGNAFIWFRRGLAPRDRRWTVFCSPPYDFFVERADEMAALIAGLIESSPAGSVIVVESDARFDGRTLPETERWDEREYSPAVVRMFWKP